MCVNVKRTGRFLSVLSPMFFVVFYPLCKFLSLSFSFSLFCLPSLSGQLQQFLFTLFVPVLYLALTTCLLFSLSLYSPLSQLAVFFYDPFSLFSPLSLSCYIRLSFCSSAHLFSFQWLAHAHILCLAGVVMVLIGGWPGY